MTLLLDGGVRSVVAAEEGEGRLHRHEPTPRSWTAPGERGRTLDDLLSGAWEGLSAAAAATACPVCEGALEPRWSAGAGIVGGRCRDCGSVLS